MMARFTRAAFLLGIFMSLQSVSARLGEISMETTSSLADTPQSEEVQPYSWEEAYIPKRNVRELFANQTDDEEIEVLIGYKNEAGLSHIESVTRDSATNSFVGDKSAETKRKKKKKKKRRAAFPEIRAVAVTLTKQELVELEQDDNIEYIETDHMLYQMASVVPYGIKLTQGTAKLPVPSDLVSAGDCSNPNAFRLSIIDSGVYAEHPDLTCKRNNGAGCIGKSFGTNDEWDKDLNSHGTHVAGTIAALGGDDLGVRGMIKDGGLCLVIGRVFPDNDGSASLSAILDAVRWAVNEQGAKVVSMSLGSSKYSTTENRLYQNMYNKKGAIVVAAAGNSGTGAKSYPASYASVVSVAAVDSSKQRASFSQYNDMVDLAAPGVAVLSTVPLGQGGLATVGIESEPIISGNEMEYSPNGNGVSGNLVDCDLGKTVCTGSSGGVCVIKRGDITFEEKALNCQNGGGKAAIIYNNAPGNFAGTLSNPTKVTIPVLSIAAADGQQIVSNHLGKTASVSVLDGYSAYDGTSMATPHVSGAVAAVWRTCGKCSNAQVVECLRTTAQDLGANGRDDYYGHGLVQTKKAYNCLAKSCCKA